MSETRPRAERANRMPPRAERANRMPSREERRRHQLPGAPREQRILRSHGCALRNKFTSERSFLSWPGIKVDPFKQALVIALGIGWRRQWSYSASGSWRFTTARVRRRLRAGPRQRRSHSTLWLSQERPRMEGTDARWPLRAATIQRCSCSCRSKMQLVNFAYLLDCAKPTAAWWRSYAGWSPNQSLRRRPAARSSRSAYCCQRKNICRRPISRAARLHPCACPRWRSSGRVRCSMGTSSSLGADCGEPGPDTGPAAATRGTWSAPQWGVRRAVVAVRRVYSVHGLPNGARHRNARGRGG